LSLDELAFPANSNVDQAIVWAVSRLVRNAAAAVTLAWSIMVVLSGISAAWCMRRLGISGISSVVAGTLFAVSPYALYRNIDHIWMVIYLVPFPCTAALLLASARPPERGYWKGYGGLLFGCALLGFNYVYYPFFACFLIGVASIVGVVADRRGRILRAGSVCIVLIAGCTLLNLAPSLDSWSRHGAPLILRDKAPAESELYGLKIRQLVSPIFEHAFPPFQWWTGKEAAAKFPLENENMISRLGLVGTVGFLAVLSLLFVPRRANPWNVGELAFGASQLTLAAILLGTIGGFGSLFSLLISPQIRAYNRITPFIAFFSLTAVALAMDAVFRTRRRRIVAAVVVLAIGLADQRMATRSLNRDYAGIAAELPPIEAFVQQLERRLPDRAMVLQLPFRTYLNDAGIARMKPYDHLKLYLVSRRIHWSYPALSNDQVRWQQAAARLDPRQLSYQIAKEGFAAVVIDRYGYEDNGAEVTAGIRAGLGANGVIAETDRYVALDLRSLAGAGDANAPLLSAKPMPVTAAMGACGGQTMTNIDRIGPNTAPFGEATLHVPGSGELNVSGWAVDQMAHAAAQGVDVLVDQTSFPAVYGTAREDVIAYFKRPEYRGSGFAAAIPMEELGRGPHALALRVVSADRRCYYQTPGRPIVVD
jgi:phosphoglycerol transferase